MDIIIWVVIGVLTIIMLLFMFSNSMSLQRFGLIEIFMIVLISVFFYVNMDKYSKIITEEYGKVASAQLCGLYSYMSEIEKASDNESLSLLYNQLEDKLNEALTGLDNTYGNRNYENAALVQKKGASYVVCSQIGIDDNFGFSQMSEISNLADTAFMNTKIRSVNVDGGTLYAVVDRGNIHATYALVIEISSKASDARIEEIKIMILIYSGAIFAAATLLAVLATIIQHNEVKKMQKLMRKIAEKKDFKTISDARKSVRIHSNEMRGLYNGICQVMSDITRDNYTINKALQVYYRFAPKNLERIMGKNSILDIEANEQVDLEATLAYVSFTIDERLEQQEQLKNINDYYMKLVENRKRYGGIIFNSSTDLSSIQMMFNEDNNSAVQFGIDLSSQISAIKRKKGSFVLLHRTAFTYGISGDEEQSFTFAHSIEMKAIEKHVDSLRRMGLRMVVTDAVHDMLAQDISSRYIGYIAERDMQFGIYEILDAYPVGERQKRVENIDKFNEALTLMYQSDFYFARTLFTEILKECPEDDVAKHYIFKCESCLNGDNSGDVRLSLF